MRRDRSGVLRCPDDSDGLDAASLDEANAAGARRRKRAQRDTGAIQDENPTAAEIAANIAALEARFGIDL